MGTVGGPTLDIRPHSAQARERSQAACLDVLDVDGGTSLDTR